MHLLVQSRSARSSVLVPLVVALSPAIGVALFAKVEGTTTYRPKDLLRLSAVLAPISAGLVLLFSLVVWPLLGLPYQQ